MDFTIEIIYLFDEERERRPVRIDTLEELERVCAELFFEFDTFTLGGGFPCVEIEIADKRISVWSHAYYHKSEKEQGIFRQQTYYLSPGIEKRYEELKNKFQKVLDNLNQE